MAKIRSTLDIVMEKTRDLSLSESDRADIRKKELEDRVRGWVQLFLDGKNSLDDMKERVDHETAAGLDVRSVLRREILGRVDPDADVSGLVAAMERVLGEDGSIVTRAVEDYRAELASGRESFMSAVRARLASRGVSGKAVVPNLNADDEWKGHVASMKDRLVAGLLASQGDAQR